MQGGSVFLNIQNFKVEAQQQVTWLKNLFRLTKGNSSDVKYYKDEKKYEMFPNGTLKIDHLVEEDSGNYKVTVYNDMGSLQVEKNFILRVQEMVSKPEIKWTCSQKLINVTCEVKQKNKWTFHLLQNNQSLPVRSTDANGTWKIEYQPTTKILTAKFLCEVKNDVSQNTTDQEIKCLQITAHKELQTYSCLQGADSKTSVTPSPPPCGERGVQGPRPLQGGVGAGPRPPRGWAGLGGQGEPPPSTHQWRGWGQVHALPAAGDRSPSPAALFGDGKRLGGGRAGRVLWGRGGVGAGLGQGRGGAAAGAGQGPGPWGRGGAQAGAARSSTGHQEIWCPKFPCALRSCVLCIWVRTALPSTCVGLLIRRSHSTLQRSSVSLRGFH
uniref:Immunoglobulin subtype domain-containing protein n=1 Tax=Chelonoidis abingdonii TaxID=106734 RepID=A0A8C0GK09_CHEAB